VPEDIPIVNSEYLLQKFPGNGGWTYAAIPEVLQNRKNPFGWVTVRGNIDGFELKQFKLMPMGDGRLFLPVRAEIRKKLGKQEGDYVRVTLYNDQSNLQIPQEIIECFKYESDEIFQIFSSFTEGEQKAYIDWIYQAKKDDTKSKRIVKMMGRLQRKMKFYERDE